ncbi:MAG: sigma-70 family RNA polymerase sigma factor [Saprospiraceae bacterium]|nr:sigma-70 family RNA polymerase sigma factor [Bacteroidia bacterium]NNF21627.1 sigma-70 family RNA polymerase sigma factor [Saprospiraceae bacterium]
MSIMTQDDHIISLMKQKDKQCIEMIYDKYAAALYGVVLRIVRNESLAQDVMQESFIKIWKNSGNYNQSKSKLYTWILTICRNTSIDKVRSLKIRREKEIQKGQSNVDNEGVNYIKPELLDVRKFVNKLDSKYVDVLEALFYKGLTQKEASEKLGVPLGTIKTRLKAGLRDLRKIYGTISIICIILIMILK